MSYDYTPQWESLYTELRRTKKILSVFAESNSALVKSNRALAEWNQSLLEENGAQGKTIQFLEEKNLEQEQLIDDLKRELDYQPNNWDNDGSSNADCRELEYAAYRLEAN